MFVGTRPHHELNFRNNIRTTFWIRWKLSIASQVSIHDIKRLLLVSRYIYAHYIRFPLHHLCILLGRMRMRPYRKNIRDFGCVVINIDILLLLIERSHRLKQAPPGMLRKRKCVYSSMNRRYSYISMLCETRFTFNRKQS